MGMHRQAHIILLEARGVSGCLVSKVTHNRAISCRGGDMSQHPIGSVVLIYLLLFFTFSGLHVLAPLAYRRLLCCSSSCVLRFFFGALLLLGLLLRNENFS